MWQLPWPRFSRYALVVLLGPPEGLRRFHLRHNAPRLEPPLRRESLDLGASLLFLFRRVEEDHRPVLRPPVRPLAVHGGRVVQRKEGVQKLLIADPRRVELQLHYLRMPGLIRAHVLVAGPVQLAALVAHGRSRHARDGRESRFDSPKTTCPECRYFSAHALSDALPPVPVTDFADSRYLGPVSTTGTVATGANFSEFKE